MKKLLRQFQDARRYKSAQRQVVFDSGLADDAARCRIFLNQHPI
jgi:hypothetical protein